MSRWIAGLLAAVAFTTPAQLFFTANGAGAVRRPISSKLGDVVSVLDFVGVDNTGVADSSTGIAAALAALPTNGGTLFFPAGTYKFNLSTTREGIVYAGAGGGNVNTAHGGTVWTAATAGSPILQLGDGATAAAARGSKVRDVLLLGDGVNATGDAVYLFGARDITIENVAISTFGRHEVFIQCNTMSSSGIHLVHVALSGARGAAIRAEYCASSFTTDITVTDSHINGHNAAGSYSIYLDSAPLWLTNTYLDLGGDGVGHVKMVKNQSPNPLIVANGAAFDNAGGAAALSLDVSTWITAANRLGTAISGTFTLNGTIQYSDATVSYASTRTGAQLQPWLTNAQVYNSLRFPLDEADTTANAVTLSRINATGGNTEAVVVSNAALRVPGTVTFPLQITGTSIWRDAVSGVLRSRFANNPSGDHQGLQLFPVLNKPTYGATITIDGQFGSVFYVTATNATPFTFNNPGNFGSSTATAQEIDICVINTSGGALGAATFSANYHLAGAWVQPATGFRRCAGFRGDDAATQIWYETWRSAADIAN